MAVALTQLAPASEDRASGAQVIDGSLILNGDKEYNFIRTPSAGNRKTWTWSVWVKRNLFGNDNYLFFNAYSALSNYAYMGFRSDDTFEYYDSNSKYLTTSSKFRDTGWYHIMVSFDTTQSTDTERIKIYINGSRVETFQRSAYPAQDSLGPLNSNTEHNLGRWPYTPEYFDGQIAQAYFIEGQQLDASYFGFTDPLTNTWRPKKASITGPNDGTVWSSGSYSGTTPSAGYGVAEAFNGVGFPGDSFGSGVQWGFFPGTATLTLPKPITLTSDSTFEIYSYHSSSSGGSISFTCSNGTVTPSLTVNATNVIGSTVVSNPFSTFGAQITAITLVSSGSDWTAIAGIAVDGVVLMDNDKTNFGPNGFYLPMDGNSPAGDDQSGRENNWTPRNFGGSVGLDKATGALPILNTNGGGTVANVGVRTDVHSSNVVLALPLVGNANDVSNVINPGSSEKTITVNGNAAATKESSNFYNGSFDFDGSGDYLTASNSSDFNPGTGDFCIEGWFKTSASVSYQTLISVYGAPSSYHGWYFGLDAAGTGFRAAITDGSSGILEMTGGTNLNDGAWHHFAVCRTGTTLQLFIDGFSVATHTNSYNITATSDLRISGYASVSRDWNGQLQDIRIYKGTGKYTSNFLPASTSPDILPDTPSGVATKTALTKITEGAVSFDGTGDYLSQSYSSDFVLDGDFTIECFVYYVSGSVMVDFSRSGSYQDAWQLYNQSPTFYGYSSGGNAVMTSDTALIRGWNHLVVTRTISNNTARMFINGVQTASSTSFSHTYGNDTSNVLSVGAQSYSGPTAYFTGYVSNLRIIKGTALYTSNFTPPSAPLTNVTNTKLLCCQSNTSATAAAVTPGSITANGDAQATTFNPFNTDVNTIRGQETIHATLNPLDQNGSSTVSNGDLDMGNSQGSSAWGTVRATIGASSGKFYAEYTCTSSSGGFRQTVGVVSLEVPNGTSIGSNVALNNLSDSAAYFNNGQKSLNGSTSSYGAAWTTGDVVGIALDVDETSVTFFVNGVSQGVASSALASDASLTFGGGNISSNETGTWNFGQKPFKFTPPDGFQALSGSSVRPEKVTPDGTKFIAAVPYAGNSATNKITTGFAPDFVWIKNRTNAYAHCLFDTVRGAGKRLESDATYGEDDYNLLNTFNDNGFTLGVQGGGGAFVQNTTGTNSMSWSWKAGGNKNTFNIDDVGYASAAAAGLDGGSTNPTGASVNTKSKFGIYTFDGNSSNRTMSHGLGQQPDFMICKKKSTSGNSWVVWHSDIANTEYILLNSTAGKATDATLFNSHASDSSTLWTIGSNTTFNETGQSSVAYLWCDVPGLQKFGKFTGNGNADGPYVELGFSPSILIIKDTAGNDWYIYDNERSSSKPLFPNGTYSEQPDDRPIDFLSNGFKIRYNQFFNGGSANMIYAAWAEAPSFNMYGASSNARATK
tara:strand:- start:1239 stop:5519 length:4281 start_codon:yes stop_codon:yes gene_type:complete